MKAVITIITLLLIGGIAYLFIGGNTDTQLPAETDRVDTVEEDQTVTDEIPAEIGDDTDTSAADQSPTADDTITEDTTDEDTGDTGSTKVFNIDGFNFGFSSDEIRVEGGDTVTINFTSTDGFHDWVVDEFDAETERVQTGGSTSVTFVADEPGTYEYYCSVGNHRAQGMVGTLIVE